MGKRPSREAMTPGGSMGANGGGGILSRLISGLTGADKIEEELPEDQLLQEGEAGEDINPDMNPGVISKFDPVGRNSSKEGSGKAAMDKSGSGKEKLPISKYKAKHPILDTIFNAGKAGETANRLNIQGEFADRRAQYAMDRQSEAFKNQEALKLQTENALRERKLLDLNSELQDMGRSWAVTKGLDPQRHSTEELRDFGLMLKYGPDLATKMKNDLGMKFDEQDRAAEYRNKVLTGETAAQKLGEAKAVEAGNIEATNIANRLKALQGTSDIEMHPSMVNQKRAENALATARAGNDLGLEPGRVISKAREYDRIPEGLYGNNPISTGVGYSVQGPTTGETTVNLNGIEQVIKKQFPPSVSTFNTPKPWNQKLVDPIINQGPASPRPNTVAPLDQATEEEKLRRMLLQGSQPAFRTNRTEYVPSVNPYK